MSSGLAKAFAERWPAMYTSYQKACTDGTLTLGALHIYHDEASKNTIVNLPTKLDWRDTLDIADTERGIVRLAAYLKEHPFHTVAMPLLGGGTGRNDPTDIPAMLTQHLDPLPNIIHLSIRPERFETPPRYLAVVGSRAFTDYDRIDLGVGDGLIEFGLTWTDFDAMVSGGAIGVDYIACGSGLPGDQSQTIAGLHGLKPIVCRADWDRYGDSAGWVRNRTVEDIATHIVAFVGKKSTGTRMLIGLVERHNAAVDKLLQERMQMSGGDLFDSPLPPLPDKKRLLVHDISAVSV
jgi:hypothetical protein